MFSIFKCVFDNYLVGFFDLVIFFVGIGGCSVGEVNVVVMNDLVVVVGEFDDVVFRVEEEEGFGGVDGEIGVCVFIVVGDFRVDLVFEDL